MQARRNFSCDLLLLSVVTIWGFNFAIIKLVYRELHPLAFNAMRFVIAGILTLVFSKAVGLSLRADRKDLFAILRLTAITHLFFQTLFVIGLANTRAGNAGLLTALTPVFAYLASLALKRERFNTGVLVGIVLSLAGVVAIVLFGSAEISIGGTWKGDLLMIGSVICWALYSATAAPLLEKYGGLRLTAITMIAGTAMVVPLSIPWIVTQNWQAISSGAWFGLLYSALLALVYAAFGWSYALSRVGVARTAVFQNITPIVAMLGGWGLLREQPTAGQIAGALLVLTGVFVVRTKKQAAIR